MHVGILYIIHVHGNTQDISRYDSGLHWSRTDWPITPGLSVCYVTSLNLTDYKVVMGTDEIYQRATSHLTYQTLTNY